MFLLITPPHHIDAACCMVCVSVFMLGTQADCESSCGLVWQASGSGTMGTGVHCTPQVQDLYRCTPQVKDAAYVKILSMRYEFRTNLYSPLMKKFRRACGRHTLVGPRNHILDAVGHRRHLVNITERSVCCGNAALCQITLTTGFLFFCHFCKHSPSHWAEFLVAQCAAYCCNFLVTRALCINITYNFTHAHTRI